MARWSARLPQTPRYTTRRLRRPRRDVRKNEVLRFRSESWCVRPARQIGCGRGANCVKEEVEELLEDLLVGDVSQHLEQVSPSAPCGVGHRRGSHEACGKNRVDASEVSAVDAALDYAGDELVRGFDDFASVELGEVGEVVELAGHQLEDRLEFGGPNEVPMGAQVRSELFGRIIGRRGDAFSVFLFRVDDYGADDVAEELFLVREVEINGAFRDTGAFGDVVEFGAGQSAFAEDLESGVEDLARSF